MTKLRPIPTADQTWFDIGGEPLVYEYFFDLDRYVRTLSAGGSGGDASTLNGEPGAYYLAWENFTGVPVTFPPSAHTHSQSDITGLVTDLAGKQPLSANLTAFAGKSAPAGAVVGTTDVQALTNKDLTGTGNTFPTFNQNTTGTAASFTGSLSGDVTGTQGATVVGKINGVSFAGLATGILKNATGTGAPSIAVAADFPILNQSTSGNAATATAAAMASKLTTARNIDGQAFDGTANITVIAPGTHAATSKATPVDADELPLVDSAASNVLKKLTWANLKATLKSYFDTIYSSSSSVRERLTAARTYYVRTDGSDSNNGLANTSGGAFLTIQKAIDVVSSLDIAGYTVTIQLADGTYTGAVTLKNVAGFASPGNLVIQGNLTTPANVVVASVASDIIIADAISSVWDLKSLKISNTTSGNGIVAKNGATVRFGNLDFGAVVLSHMIAFNGGQIVCLSNYAVSASANIHWQTYYHGTITANGFTVTITGPPTFTAWAYTSSLGAIGCNSMTFSGSASGQRYNVSSNSVVFTNTGSATYLPGSTAGATATGGQYI